MWMTSARTSAVWKTSVFGMPRGHIRRPADTNWFYQKGGIFKWPDNSKIDTVAPDDNPPQGLCYYMQGMRVMPKLSGIYIVNGKKYVK